VVNEGVLGPAVGGVRPGAMTTTFSGAYSGGKAFTYTLTGPVEYYNSLNALYGELYGGQVMADGRLINQYGQWIQSFDPGLYPFTQRYLGAISSEARPLGFNSTALSSVGWGFRDSVSPSYYSGSMTGTVSGGDPESWSEAGSARTYMMFAGLTNAASGAATGTAFPMGFLVTNNSMPHFGRMFSASYSPGAISLDAGGNSTITLNNVNLWDPEIHETPLTFSSTLTTRPGQFYYIYATGNMSVNPVIRTFDSRLVSGGPLTILNSTGPIENFSPYFDYVMRAGMDVPGDFSGFESGDHAFVVRGVLSDDGDGYMSGAMDIKSVNLSNWAVTRYLGSANRYPGGELVGNLIGVNRAVFPGAPSTQADQTGTWMMTSTSVTPQNFTQTFNGAFYVTSEYPSGFASVTGTGWGQREGVLPGYFSADISGFVALLAGSFDNSVNYYTFTSTMSGSVSGRPGNTWVGSMSWTGALSTGESFNYFGPVTITADGQLQFYYEGQVRDSSETLVANAGGKLIQTPGTYFTQTTTAPVNYAQTSYAPYNDSITYSTAEATVNRSSGPGAGAYRGSFINLHTTKAVGLWGEPSGDGAPSTGSGTLTLTTQGVMSQSGSIYTGSQTTIATIGESETISGGPVFYYPSNGVTVAQNMGSRTFYHDDLPQVEQWQGLWIQVPQASGLSTFTQTYFANGSHTPIGPDNTSATSALSGWGFRNLVVPGYYYGTSSGTTSLWGGTIDPFDAEMVQMAMAGYVGPPNASGDRSGSVWISGDATENTRLNAWPTGGSAIINNSGAATFNFSSHFLSPDTQGQFQGAMTATPGTFFYQKTDSVTESTSSASPYRVQNLAASATGAGTFPGMNNFTATLSGTNTAEQDGVFPSEPQVSFNHTYYSRGVITSGNVGSMDLTRVSNVGDLARLRAQINLDTSTNTLSGRLVGLNPVGTGGDTKVPAVQRFDYLQQLASPVSASSATSLSTSPTTSRLRR
jgi:hypothetical protein